MAVIISLVIGYVLDMIVGTPKILKRLKMMLINIIRALYRKINKKIAIVVTVAICGAVGYGIYAITVFLNTFNMIYSIIFESIVAYLCISGKDIKISSEKVYRALKRGYIKNANKLFNALTDNGEISEPREIAENMIIHIMEGAVDKVIAPIVYILIFGSVGGAVYKLIVIISDASNQSFARAVKNIAEILPTRICAGFMLISALIQGLDAKNGVNVFMKDRYNTKDINKGLILAVCAGAFGIELNMKKQNVTIGEAKKVTTHNDITRAFEMINITSLLVIVCLVVIRLVIVLFVI